MPPPGGHAEPGGLQPEPARFTAFDGHRRLASGPLHEAALAMKRAAGSGAAGPLLVFDDATGRVVDTRGTEEEVAARLSREAQPRRRGRPKLGVVAREVTLLPRHWDWLAAQPGGASVALRKLVEEARRGSADTDRRRGARDAAYRFMSAMAATCRASRKPRALSSRTTGNASVASCRPGPPTSATMPSPWLSAGMAGAGTPAADRITGHREIAGHPAVPAEGRPGLNLDRVSSRDSRDAALPRPIGA